MTFITLNVYTGDGQRFKEEITVKNDGYIDKAECLRRGYVRKSCGIYKMSLLEKYAARGWLELGDPKYSREDRLRAAKRLQKDCEMSHFMSVGVSGTREKVDGKGKNADDVEAICKARERYFAAVKQIPEEFWPVVREVCLENRGAVLTEKAGGRRKQEMSYAAKRDLCRGLDRLIRYYWSV